MDKLKELLHRGYFPIQLPPGFSSKVFSEKYKQVEGRWGAQKRPSCRAEKFSVARSSYYRRQTSIVNPIGYYFLAKEIVTYWSEIQNHFKKSKISLSKPTISPSLRAIKISRFSDLYEAKVTMSTGYRYVVITDISSFFPTIYTHTIPWALHSKPIAKKNHSKTSEFFGNILDYCCMGVQDRQTIGLPIGPDTSHIIAEIIGVSIDEEIKKGLNGWPMGFRYVDDFYFFFDTREEAEKGLAEVTKAISNYELQINPSKTKIIEVRELVDESWKYNVKKLKISQKKKAQREDIHNYFESLFSLEKKFKDESLIKYGLKQISSTIIKTSNWDIFEAYLLKCGYGFPNTLQVISTILITYNYYSYPIKKSSVKRFCNNLINTHAISDHHSEVSWLLWLCKELELKIERKTIREIEGMTSSVCDLILLDMFHSGKSSINVRYSYLKQFSNKEALYQSNWLLAYEAGRRKWLKNTDTKYIEEDNFFGALFKKDISFYDESIKTSRIFDIKESLDDIYNDIKLMELNSFLESRQVESLHKFFDEDSDINELFEFDEMDEEYFDSEEQEDESKDEDDNDFWDKL